MNVRTLGRTGFSVSEISFGAWAIGGTWGSVDDGQSMRALHRAVDLGVNFFDTADVYGGGRSERLLGRLRKERGEGILIATKAGRLRQPHTAANYEPESLRAFVERSLGQIGVETLDLLQLHCPPSVVYDRPEVFGALDDLSREGKLRFYGVSVETVDQAMASLRYPNVQSIQLVFNVFRPKPAEVLFAEAARARVGIIARLPLASGLLAGKLGPSTPFAPDDHRAFNRGGEAFDAGETFSGLPYERALEAVEELRPLAGPGVTLAQAALSWILMFPEVTCAIPGAKTPTQVEENVRAASLPRPSAEAVTLARDVYDKHFRASVHPRW